MFKLKRLLIIALGLGLFGFFGFQLIKNKDKLFGDLDLAVNEPEPYIINMKSPIDNDPINVAKVLKHYFIKSPLSAGVSVDSIKDTQLPKAVRSYRNGMHEGIDFFRVPDGRGNVRAVTKSDTVISPGYFKVVRMDRDYKEPATSEYQRMLDETFEEKIDTSSKKYQIILDKLRGRSVWLKSKDGRLILRYAHLDSISSKIKIGDILKPGTILGTVGNSGTIDGVNFREAEGLHLHFDIILDNAFIWTSFSPQQIRGILKKVLEKK